MQAADLRRSALIVIIVALLLVASGGASAWAATSYQQSPTVTFSPDPTAGRPVYVTVSGYVDRPSQLQVFADLGTAPCGSQAGDRIADTQLPSGSFNRTSQFTPVQAGTYAICVRLDAAAQTASGTNVQSQMITYDLTVAPASAPGSTSPAQAAPLPSATAPAHLLALTKRCRVPSLKRHTVHGAAALLARAHCRLGRVYRPSLRARSAARRAYGHAPVLAVIAQNPRAGRLLPHGSLVAIRLGIRSPSHAPH